MNKAIAQVQRGRCGVVVSYTPMVQGDDFGEPGQRWLPGRRRIADLLRASVTGR